MRPIFKKLAWILFGAFCVACYVLEIQFAFAHLKMVFVP